MVYEQLKELQDRRKAAGVKIIDIARHVNLIPSTVSSKLNGYAPADSRFIRQVEELISEYEGRGEPSSP
jgi:transcriptional regulator with XRE-family HTH domain